MNRKSFLLAFAVMLTCSQTAFAQRMDKDQACNLLVPRFLQFISSISEIPDSFDRAMETGFDTNAQREFSDVAVIGHELAAVAVRYRQAFLAACYGEQ